MADYCVQTHIVRLDSELILPDRSVWSIIRFEDRFIKVQ